MSEPNVTSINQILKDISLKTTHINLMVALFVRAVQKVSKQLMRSLAVGFTEMNHGSEN